MRHRQQFQLFVAITKRSIYPHIPPHFVWCRGSLTCDTKGTRLSAEFKKKSDDEFDHMATLCLLLFPLVYSFFFTFQFRHIYLNIQLLFKVLNQFYFYFCLLRFGLRQASLLVSAFRHSEFPNPKHMLGTRNEIPQVTFDANLNQRRTFPCLRHHHLDKTVTLQDGFDVLGVASRGVREHVDVIP